MTLFAFTLSYLSIAILIGLLRYVEAVGPVLLVMWVLLSLPLGIAIGSAMKRAGR